MSDVSAAMHIVDTNVVAFLLIAGEHTERARALLDIDPDWHSETYLMVEMTNVLATQVRLKRLTIRQANSALDRASAVMESGLHLAGHGDALSLAAKLSISAYDARFLVIAEILGLPLVTEDSKLRKAAPSHTITLDEALRSA